MELVLHGVDSTRRVYGYNPAQKTLGAIMHAHHDAVLVCRVNGVLVEDWQTYTPQSHDTIALWMRPGLGSELAAALIAALITSIVSFGISYGLGLLLQNKPDPTRQQRNEDTFGIAGLSNTIAVGTPKVLVYGTRRVFGHIIGTQVSAYVRGMEFSILYFMGDGEVESLTNIEINEIPIAQFPGASFVTRTGTDPQDAIAQWTWPVQVYYDGRELALQQAIVYQTRSASINDITLIVSVPYLQTIRANTHNSFRDPGEMRFRIETKRLEGDAWHTERFGGNAYFRMHGTVTHVTFAEIHLVMAIKAQWQVRVTLIDNSKNDQRPNANLYNVQELERGGTARTYPHSALLSISGVASAQITSFESMKASALVNGRRVLTWNGATYTRRFTRNRAWVIRDIVTDPRVGMGHRIPPSLWDDDAALSAATYYMGEIAGEARDYCDVVINQRRPAWDWIRELAIEGNAALVASQGKLKLLIDRPQTARRAFSNPGNMADNSVSSSLGSTGDVPNTIRGEFTDASRNYRLSILEVQAADMGGELLKEATISLKSIVRPSQAQRSLSYALKKQRLQQRRWTWRSPLTGMPSEPFDVVRLGYLTATQQRGVEGFLQAGSTGLRLVLDQLVALELNETYEVVIVLQRNNHMMSRTFIAEATRRQHTIDVAPALEQVPQAGDLYLLGRLARSMTTVMLEKLELNTQDDTYTISGVEYRSEIYDTSGTGAVPSTIKAFHDFPAMHAQDATTRYHASYLIDPVTPMQTLAVEPWPGAQLFRSRDVEPDYELSYQGAPLPCFGAALTTLGAALPQRTDLASTVDVHVDNGMLTTITAHEMQLGFNLLFLGQELLQFRIATSLGSGNYRLSQLRRGRRGTEWATTTHSTGETCLLVGTGIFTRDVLRVERDRARNWKSPSIGQDVLDVPATAYAVASRNLQPWTPGSARGQRLVDGTWVLSWRGRARFLGAWVDLQEALPDYDVHTYRLTIFGDSTRATIVHDVELGQSMDYQALQTYQYASAQQAADFGSVQNTLYWTLQQVGTDDVSVAPPLTSTAGEGT
jgi:hypothetical protein